MRYTVVLVPDSEDGGFVAYVPVPGVVTQGETIEEAMAMAADAVALVAEDASERGEDLPAEAPGSIVGSIDIPNFART